MHTSTIRVLLESLPRALPVLINTQAGLFFAYTYERGRPMVRIAPGAGAYVAGRPNARRFDCVETNLAFYPSAAQARRDAMTVQQLHGYVICDSHSMSIADTILVLCCAPDGQAQYRPVAGVTTGRISATGRPELQSRGGIQAALLSVAWTSDQITGTRTMETDELKREATLAFENHYQVDAKDPSQAERLAVWLHAYTAAHSQFDDDLAFRAIRGKYGPFLGPFVAFMEAELHANAGKGDRPGWLSMTCETALLEIFYHLGKLHRAVRKDDIELIVEHTADVANASMMLLDICGGLPVAGDRYTASQDALSLCAAGRDGDCVHSQCPQLRDGEPARTGRHCPLDKDTDEQMEI